MEWNNIEPEIEVVSENTISNRLNEVLICRSNHTDIDFDALGPADSAYLTFLEHV